MWLSEAWRKYAEFNGRAVRREYWGFVLLVALVSIVTALIDFSIGLGFAGYGPATIIMLLVLAVPGVAVTARRLHDFDFSGWWMLMGFVPYVGFVVMLIVGVYPGTRGENRFGPDPRERGPADHAVAG